MFLETRLKTFYIGYGLLADWTCIKTGGEMAVTNTLEFQRVKSVRRDQSDLPLNEEQDLIVQARNGSSAAIELLVSRYESRLFRLARNITGNHEDTEEVIQNAFVKAFQNLATFRGDSGFYTWLVRIAINQALMKVRGRHFKEVSIDQAKDSDGDITPRDPEDWGPNPEERYSQEELRRILNISVSKLDPKYRIVFQLRDVEGLTTDETARALDLSVPAVKTRLARARLQLRNSLDTYFRRPKSRDEAGLATRVFELHDLKTRTTVWSLSYSHEEPVKGKM
jgi:RNA polymerase sigma-70 factor (ECF subfamily)